MIAAAAQNGFRFSIASSDSGRNSDTGPSRWPVLWATRYGASANARPPTSDAPRGSPSERSQAHAAPPAAGYVRSVKTFHASTAPSAATSGQYGSPKTSPWKFARGESSGRKLYGSRHGAFRCPSWWSNSQRFQLVCRWSPGVASAIVGGAAARKCDVTCASAGHVARKPASA